MLSEKNNDIFLLISSVFLLIIILVCYCSKQKKVNEGFQNTHTIIKGATSREKALYYFYKNDINYDHIWFIEEDVFIPTIETIKNIDIKYPDNDLLVSGNKI